MEDKKKVFSGLCVLVCSRCCSPSPPSEKESLGGTPEASRCYFLVGNERLLVKSVSNLKEGQQKRTRDLGVAFSPGKITKIKKP